MKHVLDQSRAVAALAALSLVVSACGSTTPTETGVPSPTVATTPTPKIFVYANRQIGDQTPRVTQKGIAVYKFDAATGALTPTGDKYEDLGKGTGAFGRFVYSNLRQTITAYAVDPASGGLSLVGDMALPSRPGTVMQRSGDIIVNQTDALSGGGSGYGFQADSGFLSTYRFDSRNGALAPLSGRVAYNPGAFAFREGSDWLFAQGLYGLHAVDGLRSGFLRDRDVVLSELPNAIAAHPKMNVLYLILRQDVLKVLEFSELNGAVKVLQDFPLNDECDRRVNTSLYCGSIATDPEGAFVFATGSAKLQMFETTGDGRLRSLETYALHPNLYMRGYGDRRFLGVDPTGNFLFVGTDAEETGLSFEIHEYRINRTTRSLVPMGVVLAESAKLFFLVIQ